MVNELTFPLIGSVSSLSASLLLESSLIEKGNAMPLIMQKDEWQFDDLVYPITVLSKFMNFSLQQFEKMT